MAKSKDPCRKYDLQLDRAMMRYEKAAIKGHDTKYKAQVVRKIRALKKRCESDVTPELKFNGLRAKKRKK